MNAKWKRASIVQRSNCCYIYYVLYHLQSYVLPTWRKPVPWEMKTQNTPRKSWASAMRTVRHRREKNSARLAKTKSIFGIQSSLLLSSLMYLEAANFMDGMQETVEVVGCTLKKKIVFVFIIAARCSTDILVWNWSRMAVEYESKCIVRRSKKMILIKAWT